MAQGIWRQARQAKATTRQLETFAALRALAQTKDGHIRAVAAQDYARARTDELRGR